MACFWLGFERVTVKVMVMPSTTVGLLMVKVGTASSSRMVPVAVLAVDEIVPKAAPLRVGELKATVKFSSFSSSVSLQIGITAFAVKAFAAMVTSTVVCFA
jgi:hypothetical protein